MTGERVKNFLYSAFHWLFIATFALIVGIVFFYKETLADKAIMLVSTEFFLLVIVFLYKYIVTTKWKEARFGKRELILLFLLFIGIQILLGITLRVKPSWDFGYVYDEAVSLTKNGNWDVTNQSYFLMYPNNQFYLLTLTCIYKLLSVFHIAHYVIVGILANIVFVDISLWILYFCMKKLWGKKIALFGLILSFMCSAYFTYLPIFYTDTFPLPFANVMLLLYIVILKEKDTKKSLGYMLLLGLACMIGFEYKATVIIMLIAIVLHVLFLLPIKKSMALILVGCAAFLGSVKLYTTVFHHMGMLDETKLDRYNYPYTHWVMMGLKTPGGYNEKDFYYTKSFLTKKEKTDANLNVIKDRIDAMDGIGVLDHFAKKINHTWNDGTYFAPKLLARKPITKGFVREVFAKDGSYETFFQIYADGLHYAILILMIFSAVHGLNIMKHTRKMDFMSCIRLAVYGLFVFLLIWESKSKYLVNYLPLMYFMAIDGMNFVWKLWKREENMYDEIGNRSTLL